MNKPIQLDGLTLKQVDMLDTMWHLDTTAEFEEWLENLSPTDCQMAVQLQMLLLIELNEQYADTDVTEANKLLKKYML